jgi:hypothetical protein
MGSQRGHGLCLVVRARPIPRAERIGAVDVHDRHDVWRVERMLLTAAALIFAVSFMFLVMWLTMSEQKTKLYEADNIVCASQPLATNCWERKPR